MVLRVLTCIQELDEELAFLMGPGRQDAYTKEDTSDLFGARSRAQGALASYLDYVRARVHPSLNTITAYTYHIHVQQRTLTRAFVHTKTNRFPQKPSKKLAEHCKASPSRMLKGDTNGGQGPSVPP